MTFFFFFTCTIFFSVWDIRHRIVPDYYIFPAIFLLIAMQYFEGILLIQNFIAGGVVVLIFLIPIALNMNFGGGDLRYGFFCGLFLGLPLIGYFFIISGVIHLLILSFARKKEFGFVPAMSLATLVLYGSNFL